MRYAENPFETKHTMFPDILYCKAVSVGTMASPSDFRYRDFHYIGEELALIDHAKGIEECTLVMSPVQGGHVEKICIAERSGVTDHLFTVFVPQECKQSTMKLLDYVRYYYQGVYSYERKTLREVRERIPRDILDKYGITL
jgi:hypothetical protein